MSTQVSILAHCLYRNGKSVHGARCPMCRELASILVREDGSQEIKACRKHFVAMDPERPTRDSVVRFTFAPEEIAEQEDSLPPAA